MTGKMDKPSLHDILKKHKARHKTSGKSASGARKREEGRKKSSVKHTTKSAKKKPRKRVAKKPAKTVTQKGRRQKTKATKKRATAKRGMKEARIKARHEQMPDDSPRPKRVFLSPENAKRLFLDVPSHHKFWRLDGKEINNLSELYMSLVEMDQATFGHHVDRDHNDFAEWVEKALGDTLLARRLGNSISRLEHAEIVQNRIEELKYPRRERPLSYLRPNYSFIGEREERPGPVAYRQSRPSLLKADTSFIAGSLHRSPGEGRFEQLLHGQEEVMDTLKQESAGHVMMDSELRSLEKQFNSMADQVSSIKEELGTLKGFITQNQGQRSRDEDKHMQELKTTVQELREREQRLYSELKRVGHSEEEMRDKNEKLLKRGKELERKESEVLRKERDYHKLMQRYNDAVKSINQRISEDEHKIASLLSRAGNKDTSQREDSPHYPKGRIAEHDRVKHDDEAASADKSHKADKTDKEDDHDIGHKHGHHHKHGKTHEPDREPGSSAKHADPSSSAEEKEKQIDDLLADAKRFKDDKKHNQAKEALNKVTSILESDDFDKEFRKSVYFQIFELGTDLNLAK